MHGLVLDREDAVRCMFGQNWQTPLENLPFRPALLGRSSLLQDEMPFYVVLDIKPMNHLKLCANSLRLQGMFGPQKLYALHSHMSLMSKSFSLKTIRFGFHVVGAYHSCSFPNRRARCHSSLSNEFPSLLWLAGDYSRDLPTEKEHRL